MKELRFATLAVFVIFFGIALIEAVQQHNWLEATLFLAVGLLSLWADFRGTSGAGSKLFCPTTSITNSPTMKGKPT